MLEERLLPLGEPRPDEEVEALLRPDWVEPGSDEVAPDCVALVPDCVELLSLELLPGEPELERDEEDPEPLRERMTN